MKTFWLAPLITAAAIIGLLGLTLAPYGGNPSALFHYGTDQETGSLPAGFVVLDLPSYDGAMYYRIARQLPFINPDIEPKSYAYQRILLPAFARVLALGNVAWLPWTFLLINVCALVGTAFLLQKHALAAIALALSPAALLGLHFSLAEPLTILLLTVVLLRTRVRVRLDVLDVIFLSLAVLTREINILFVGFAAVWFLCNRRWNDALWLLIPLAVFAAWHAVIFSLFREWPFFMSADKHALPLVAVWEIISGAKGYNAYTLSSIALLIAFVLPTLGWTIARIVKGDRTLPILGALAFLILMLCMPDHIWGSVTSIGRVITPVYPCAVLALSTRDSWPARAILSATLLLGLTVGFSLALNLHAFHLA